MARASFSLLSSLVAVGAPPVDEMRIVSVIPLSPPLWIMIASTAEFGRADTEAHESTASPATIRLTVLKTSAVSAI
jgi:hypothetical protein